MRVESTDTILTGMCQTGQILKMPIAHAEGRYIPDDHGIKALQDNDQILFRYCTPDGKIFSDNGSTDDIAGICNKDRNVFGMMPHPERASDPLLGNTDGRLLFESILNLVTTN